MRQFIADVISFSVFMLVLPVYVLYLTLLWIGGISAFITIVLMCLIDLLFKQEDKWLSKL